MRQDIRIAEVRGAFPEYEIIEEIEEGNIKQVYRGEVDGQEIAFKILTVDEESRAEAYAEREIEIMESIDSEILVRLLDSFERDINGTRALVMIEEYISGKTLKEVIEQNEYSIDLGVRVAQTLMSVLPEFDKKNIVHRDIKPANIMIADDGEVRLIDVGVARMNEKETLTPDFKRHAPGTIAYSAPEMLRNETGLQDVRTDIFSSGIVMFESACGTHPFDFSSEGLSYQDSILQSERKSLTDMVTDHRSEAIDKIFRRMTELEPSNRYRKPEFVLDDLEDLPEAA